MNSSIYPHNIVHKITAGLVCNDKSKYIFKDDKLFITFNSYISIFNIYTCELIETYKLRNKQITSLNIIKEILLIGYKDGILLGYEYENKIKKFSLRVLNKISNIVIASEDSFLFSSSSKLYLYNIDEENITREYKEINTTYNKILCINKIIVGCGNNNAIYIYTIDNIYADYIKAYDKNIINILHKNNAIILFFSNEIIEINLNTYEEKIIFNMKNMMEIYLNNDNLLIRKKNTLYEYKYDDFTLLNKTSINFKYSRIEKYRNEIIFILPSNKIIFYDEQILTVKREIAYHNNTIFNIFYDKYNIITVSSDCAIIWEYNDKLEIRNKIIHNITSAYYYKKYLYLRINNRLIQYDIQSLDIINNIIGNENSKMVTYDDYLIELNKNLCYIFNIEDGSKIEVINVESDIICCVVHKDIIALSLMDNQIELYDIKTGEMKKRIYGHSLPTRSMEFSIDGKKLLSSGCDKLLKMWGTEHGEIQKTLLSNSFSAKFIENDLFISCEEEQFRYYKNFEEIFLFAECNAKIVVQQEENLIFGNFGLSIYKIDNVPFSIDDHEIYTELEIEDRDRLNEYFIALDSKNSELLNIILQFSKFEFKILIDYMKVDSLNFLIEQIRKAKSYNLIKLVDLFIIISIKYKEVGGIFSDISDIYEVIKSKFLEENNRLEKINFI